MSLPIEGIQQTGITRTPVEVLALFHIMDSLYMSSHMCSKNFAVGRVSNSSATCARVVVFLHLCS